MPVLALLLFVGTVLPVAATETASDEEPPPVASILADLPPQVRQEIEKEVGMPAASTDVEARLEAVFQASKVISRGREIRVPILMSSIVLTEVMIITKNGRRK